MSGDDRRVVTHEAAAHVRVVTIDRPPVNALDHPTYEQLLAAFEEIAGTSDVRAVVLTASGSRAFCAGTDVGDFGNQHLDDPTWSLKHSRLVRTVFEAIYACPVPVIAAINGPCLGAGVGLAACCDAIIAAEGATIGLPEINVGVLGGARFLHRLVPQQLTRVLMYTGRRIPLSDLVTHGSVLAVVPGEDLLDAGVELAREIAEKSPTAVRMAKRGLNHLEVADLNMFEGYRHEQSLTEELAHHPDAAAAAGAFLAGKATG